MSGGCLEQGVTVGVPGSQGFVVRGGHDCVVGFVDYCDCSDE